jgi:outer membrane protein assembly factor BamD
MFGGSVFGYDAPFHFSLPDNMIIDRVLSTTFRFIALLAILFLAGCKSDGDERDAQLSAPEIYETAKRSMRNGAYDRAIQNYRLLQSRFPFGRYTEQAQLELGYAYYKNYDPELAISTMDRFIRTYPTHPNVDYAFYLKGLANFSRGKGLLTRVLPGEYSDRDQDFARRAFQDFSELLRQFPDSRYADDARSRMIYLRAEMAQYEIHVAQYYLRREAYVAAANRAKYVLETYLESPSTGDALAILAEAYQHLELDELSQDTRRVLMLNYPEHPSLTGVTERKTWVERLWPFD